MLDTLTTTTTVRPIALAARNHNIDAFRVIANLAVICVHTGPFMTAAFEPEVRLWGEWLNQLARVATPFFFLAAGYFFAASVARGALPVPHAVKLIKRLMVYFAFWSVVYVFLPVEIFLRAPDAGYWSAVHVMLSRSLSMHFLLNGAKIHLWFLPALSCSLALLAAACRWHWERGLVGMGVALYVIGLIGGAYKTTPIGLDLGLNTRDGPFFGTVFVVSGFMIHRWGLQGTLRHALGLIALGLALRIVELLWITSQSGAAPSGIDYLLGTYPFGVGIFLMLLTTMRLGENRWMVRLSRYSAGVYCAHVLIVELLMMTAPRLASPVWELARPFVALALTLALVASLARIRVLRPIVT